MGRPTWMSESRVGLRNRRDWMMPVPSVLRDTSHQQSPAGADAGSILANPLRHDDERATAPAHLARKLGVHGDAAPLARDERKVSVGRLAAEGRAEQVPHARGAAGLNARGEPARRGELVHSPAQELLHRGVHETHAPPAVHDQRGTAGVRQVGDDGFPVHETATPGGLSSNSGKHAPPIASSSGAPGSARR